MLLAIFVMCCPTTFALQGVTQPGSIRGVVRDKDFDIPLGGASITIVESKVRVTSDAQGNFTFPSVAAGTYTLVFAKDGYERAVRADVLVQEGRLTDVDAALAGEFTDMDEFVVQDILQLGGGSEGFLLKQRFESPALLDSIGADLMSRAGAGDAASGLRLVAGASVQNGKFAVIRGLPDRYVSSQMNGVRLPSADQDKRAVELDQFPSAVIESIQVSKSFTPDQQGDASGGAVNVRLKGLPDETGIQLKAQIGTNSQTLGEDSFLTFDQGRRTIQGENLGHNWDGSYAVDPEHSPTDYKLSLSGGGKSELSDGVRIGGFASVFYERSSSHVDDGRSDSYWVENVGGPMVPQTFQGISTDDDFKSGLFDYVRSTETVRWGGLGTFGIESENHRVGLTYLYTRTDTDQATLATDTRGKAYFFPSYDPNDPAGTGNHPDELQKAPYLRTDTLEHTERTTETFQFGGRHVLPFEGFSLGSGLRFKKPELSWTLAFSSAALDQPDKRQLGALWHAASFNPGFPPVLPPSTSDPIWLPFKPAANFTIGNAQRIFKTIDEDSRQFAVDAKFPFEQWSEKDGYLKFGLFHDDVDRQFNQDTFSNFSDPALSYVGGWDQPWSEVFPSQNHAITASQFDVDYHGEQKLSAYYGMVDLPLSSRLSVVGGARVESFDIGIVNVPDSAATWFPPGSVDSVQLHPGDADVDFSQSDVLPSIGLTYEATDKLTVRASYSQTVAHQTFKELAPILQQEYLGGPTFIGNPELQMSALQNYDLRVDYTPYEGGLVSGSVFVKKLDQPIEYVQRVANAFDYTSAVNYPEGTLQGVELEVRQELGRFSDSLKGLGVGANATLIDAKVTLPTDEAQDFASPLVGAPLRERDMTNAPDHLYNFFVTYDLESTKTQFALFYTLQGDTLVAGATVDSNNLVPSVYAREYGTLNLSLSQALSDHVKLQLQAKNLTNPDIEEVYRSRYIGDDVTKTSYSKGVEFTLGLTASF